MIKKIHWKVTRSRGQHFTADELALIAQRFSEGVLPIKVAAELHCAKRNIYKRYAQLRRAAGETPKAKIPLDSIKIGSLREAEKLERPKRPPADRASRFYRSNFEPS